MLYRSLESENNTADEPIDTNEPETKKLKPDAEWSPQNNFNKFY